MMKRSIPDLKANSSSDADARGFAPIADSTARILILGSMPGVASLRAAAYYAHPRNAFWPIMGQLIGAGPELDYQQRVEKIKMHHIAIWDVLARCRRVGSLDSAIDPQSAEVNNFAKFFAAHPQLDRVLFNGAAAQQLFVRHVDAEKIRPKLMLQRLPSTSPAHAGLRFEAKLEQWRHALFAPINTRV